MFSRIILLFSLVLLVQISNVAVLVKADIEADKEEMARELKRKDTKKSPNRKLVIQTLEAAYQDNQQRIQDHDQGIEKMDGATYWETKAGQKQYTALINMFKSNMSDEFVTRMIEGEIEKSERLEKQGEQSNPETWLLLFKLLTGNDWSPGSGSEL